MIKKQKGITNTVVATLLSLASAVFLGFGGYSLNSIFDLQESSKKLEIKITETHLNIAQKYISKEDINELKRDIMDRLDRMESRLTEKKNEK